MSTVLTAAQMRAIEQTAIDAREATGLELMERAGRGAVEAILQHWPDLATGPQSALVLCGPGNNGGDGFVVARRLRELGWQVSVHFYGSVEKLGPDAKINFDLCPVSVAVNEDWWKQEHWGLDLIVDAMFGTGTIRQPDGEMQRALAALGNGATDDTRVASLDIPSGVDADTGKARLKFENGTSYATEADLTVTFHRPKIGLYLDEGPDFTSKIAVVDIGLEVRAPFETAISHDHDPNLKRVWLNELTKEEPRTRGDSEHQLSWLFDKSIKQGHKYSHGHAVLLSGGVGRGGAARLAARAALRVGAGLVTVGCPPAALIENAARLDAIMLRSIADDAALTDMLGDPRITALCLGPGLGLKPREAALVRTALTAPGGDGEARPLVLDADALTLLAQDQSLFDALHPGCVLTPHAGEFARLFPDIARRLGEEPTSGPAYSKVDATRDAAARAGCVVLYKGADTVIATPSGDCSINAALYDRAAPWLATAGSGDVLAGLITGLLARGLEPMAAAEIGAWLHVEAARHFGPGLIAEDLPEALPAVMRALLP